MVTLDTFNTVVAVLSLLLAWIAFKSQSKKKELVWDMAHVQSNLFSPPEHTPFSKQVSILTLCNIGKSSILADDFESDFLVEPLAGSACGYVVIPGHEKFINDIGIDENGQFYLRPNTLNSGDEFSVAIINSYLINGHGSIHLDGHIRDIKKFDELIFRKYSEYIRSTVSMAIIALLWMIFFEVSLWYFLIVLFGAYIYLIASRLVLIAKLIDGWRKTWKAWFGSEESKEDFLSKVKIKSIDGC